MDVLIHPSAIVDAAATIGAGCSIGAYAVIEAGVCLGEGCVIASHVILRKGSRLGDGVQVDSFSVVGGDPQLTGFDRAIESEVHIDDRVVLREGCTVHRSMYAGKATTIGSDCLLMAQSHVAHDCKVGEATTLANTVLLGGHVQVGEHCFLGGGCAVHQFCRIGAHTIVGGLASISMDVPPACMAVKRNHLSGLNLVGLRRSKIASSEIKDLKLCYHEVFKDGGSFKAKAKAVLEKGTLGRFTLGKAFLKFFESGGRGFASPYKKHG
ncbi:MAG: Acyl-[acyl-carrier-protein]--UDP-N-acetylglucosamine O-acyltransferase [Opitutia bacterium UBA7350]|nr:MAG: Acyl-[acyl-carrier-protein]--UDP-N-acetylglucosamine O-acyltransferase [Opitutae bacterium UBA7350]